MTEKAIEMTFDPEEYTALYFAVLHEIEYLPQSDVYNWRHVLETCKRLAEKFRVSMPVYEPVPASDEPHADMCIDCINLNCSTAKCGLGHKRATDADREMFNGLMIYCKDFKPAFPDTPDKEYPYCYPNIYTGDWGDDE